MLPVPHTSPLSIKKPLYPGSLSFPICYHNPNPRFKKPVIKNLATPFEKDLFLQKYKSTVPSKVKFVLNWPSSIDGCDLTIPKFYTHGIWESSHSTFHDRYISQEEQDELYQKEELMKMFDRYEKLILKYYPNAKKRGIDAAFKFFTEEWHKHGLYMGWEAPMQLYYTLAIRHALGDNDCLGIEIGTPMPKCDAMSCVEGIIKSLVLFGRRVGKTNARPKIKLGMEEFMQAKVINEVQIYFGPAYKTGNLEPQSSRMYLSPMLDRILNGELVILPTVEQMEKIRLRV